MTLGNICCVFVFIAVCHLKISLPNKNNVIKYFVAHVEVRKRDQLPSVILARISEAGI